MRARPRNPPKRLIPARCRGERRRNPPTLGGGGCQEYGNTVSRKEGNGILNSVLSGGSVPYGITVKFLVWNYIPYEEWKNGASSLTYEQALSKLYTMVGMDVEVIKTLEVGSMKEAYKFNNEMLKAQERLLECSELCV